jgi:hypothetical protein
MQNNWLSDQFLQERANPQLMAHYDNKEAIRGILTEERGLGVI